MPSHYTRIVLNERPPGDMDSRTFRSEKASYSELKVGDDQVLVQVTWLSLDPAMHGWLRGRILWSIYAHFSDSSMRAGGLGVIVNKGRDVKLKIGQLVSGTFGWTEYAVVREKDAEAINVSEGVLDIDYSNNLGMAGLSAYFGLEDIGQVKAGETLVVSGAAGAVGSMICQLGLRAGAKVHEIGVMKAINYKSPSFRKELKTTGYLDVYFDNVAGDILEMCSSRLNRNARIVLCDSVGKPKGIQNYLTLISQAKIEDFIVFDYARRYPEAIAEMSQGLRDGTIKRKFHIVEGLENAPSALLLLFTGGNTRKL
ncbi:MAG: hypothetical protein NXY57DRAFT_1046192 [Lentinula lateritia]|nr:MAG: hypothetical protein NXY57DRAFT_1046192 [Lentinula lateritia]